MIHVRVVSTPELLEPMLRRVEADDAVVNIVVVEGVCRRPYGHLVLLDVTEEAAHQLLDALEQLGLTESGSVALEHAPFTVSRAAEQAEAVTPGHPEEAVLWDEVLVRARSDATLTLSLVVFMVIAAVIAAVGILTDSPILIVGAMVVSPDFNPISALTVALFLGLRRLAGQAAATLAWGFLFAVAATMVHTFVVEAIDRVPEVFAFTSASSRRSSAGPTASAPSWRSWPARPGPSPSWSRRPPRWSGCSSPSRPSRRSPPWACTWRPATRNGPGGRPFSS
ncbi:MAG TPA: DUF389 domain-containing protein [Acidimicrobiales bacterium]|nr:DUF389 domain-containing protein [Acidimicrobiales bacterium]